MRRFRTFPIWAFITLVALEGVFASSMLRTTEAVAADTQVYTPQEIIDGTNEFRSSIGIPLLKENARLDIAAQQKLQDMVRYQYFDHYSPQGVSPWHWFSVNGYHYTYAGENLAIGFLDAESVIQAWVHSAEHRRNLANTHYRDIGVAVTNTNIKDMKGVLVVELFGVQDQSTSGGTSSQENGFSVGFSGTKAETLSTDQTASTSQDSVSQKEKPVELTFVSSTDTQNKNQEQNVAVTTTSTESRTNRIDKILRNPIALSLGGVASLALLYLLFRRRIERYFSHF